MKRLIVFSLTFLIFSIQTTSATGIFSNGTASEDSISISVYLTDSLGNPSKTQADSFYIGIMGPSGDSILALAGVASTSGLDVDSFQTSRLGWQYIYSQAISEIDGSGRPGTYELTFCAADDSPYYVNCSRTTFQVISTHLNTQMADLTVILDSVLAVLDSLQNQDDWVSSFDRVNDTVISDMVRISGDDSAADNLESMLDGTGSARLALAGLDVLADGNDTAVVIRANGTGTGLGVYVLGGGNGGEGIRITGGNTKSALVAEAGATVGAAHGFDLAGAGDGFGLNGTFSTAIGQAMADAIWDEDTADHQDQGSFGAMLKDTSAYQGGASGLTAGEIADSVWDESQTGHIAAGTFGSYLDAAVSSIESPSGDGLYPVTLTAVDSAIGLVIPGTRMAVHNATLNTILAIGLTDAGGTASFNLDNGFAVVSAFAPGYVFAAYDSISVSGATVDSIVGYRFDPGNPASPDLCRVYGYLYGIDGLPMEGVAVTAQLSEGGVQHDGLIISPYKRTTQSDSIGYFYLDLIPSETLEPSDLKYLISAADPSGTILKKAVSVPDTPTWLLDW